VPDDVHCRSNCRTTARGRSRRDRARRSARAGRAGADDFVSKPYDPEVLTSRLLVAERIVTLQDRVKRLEGILSTCMYCKKIRDERDRWVSIESYISRRSDASFSHGVCPECYDTIVKPELDRGRPT